MMETPLSRKLIYLGCDEVVAIITLTDEMIDGLRDLCAVKVMPRPRALHFVQWWATDEITWQLGDFEYEDNLPASAFREDYFIGDLEALVAHCALTCDDDDDDDVLDVVADLEDAPVEMEMIEVDGHRVRWTAFDENSADRYATGWLHVETLAYVLKHGTWPEESWRPTAVIKRYAVCADPDEQGDAPVYDNVTEAHYEARKRGEHVVELRYVYDEAVPIANYSDSGDVTT